MYPSTHFSVFYCCHLKRQRLGVTHWHGGHVPDPEPTHSSTAQRARLGIRSLPPENHLLSSLPLSLLTFLAHCLQKACSGHHAWQGWVPPLHGKQGSPIYSPQGRQRALVRGATYRLCDSGQPTGDSGKGSSIRQGYLQVTENDSGGYEQKWNLLKDTRKLKLCKGQRMQPGGNRPGTASEIQLQSWPRGRHSHPEIAALAVCMAERQRPGRWGDAGCSWKNSCLWKLAVARPPLSQERRALPSAALHSKPGEL